MVLVDEKRRRAFDLLNDLGDRPHRILQEQDVDVLRHAVNYSCRTAKLKEFVVDEVVQSRLNRRCNQVSEVPGGKNRMNPNFRINGVHIAKFK